MESEQKALMVRFGEEYRVEQIGKKLDDEILRLGSRMKIQAKDQKVKVQAHEWADLHVPNQGDCKPVACSAPEYDGEKSYHFDCQACSLAAEADFRQGRISQRFRNLIQSVSIVDVPVITWDRDF